MPLGCLNIEHPSDRLDNIRSGISDSLRAVPDNLLQKDRSETALHVNEQKSQRIGQRVHLHVRGLEVQARINRNEESIMILKPFMLSLRERG